jgi:acyl dehydratase
MCDSRKEVRFDELSVLGWCEEHGDPNELHIDEEVASETTFGKRIVPGMMLLDELSGMLTELGDDDETVILAGITAARFRDPVLLGETVSFSIEVSDEDKRFTYVDFEARVEGRDSLVANGVLSVVIE